MPGELSPGQLKSLENKGGSYNRGGVLINISIDTMSCIFFSYADNKFVHDIVSTLFRRYRWKLSAAPAKMK